MAKDYAAHARQAAELTNKQLGSQITDLTRMTTSDLDRLLPLKRDREAFVELMRIVQQETDDDAAAARVTTDITRFGKTIIRALRYFA